jgi:hypothetical protein
MSESVPIHPPGVARFGRPASSYFLYNTFNLKIKQLIHKIFKYFAGIRLFTSGPPRAGRGLKSVGRQRRT